MAKLYMLLIGCRLPGRFTEQHDIFFGIAESIKDVLPQLTAYWPEAKGRMHIDAWREVSCVNGFSIKVCSDVQNKNEAQLFFINLGGYRKGEFDEPHYKLLVASATKNEAIKAAKQTAFFKHTGFAGAPSHIDDKYGVDVDDVYAIADILSPALKQHYHLSITKASAHLPEDEIHLGYFKLSAVDKWAYEEKTL